MGQKQRPASARLSSAADSRQMLEYNATDADYPRHQCIHEIFQAQVRRTPKAIALSDAGQTLTYAELNKKSNRLAHYLIKQGVGPEVRVGLCMQRSMEMLIGLLAILKAGGSYVPLDPGYPKERLEYMLSDSQVGYLLIQAGSEKAAFRQQAIRCLYLDHQSPQLHSGKSDNPRTRVEPDNPAYVIYTSGSTGRPKGVVMPHRVLVNLIHWQLQNSFCGLAMRTLQYTPISFDVSFQELFSTWCVGGRLVLITDTERKDPAALWRFIAAEKINRLFMPFIALQQLAEAYDSQYSQTKLDTLREIITAGEQLQLTSQIRRFFQGLKHCRLINQYGPSESHVVTALSLHGAIETWPSLPSIGRPIANSKIYILDKALKPVPIGVQGNVYIGGDCLARAYLDRPGLSAERFIPNAYNKGKHSRLYQTGDVGCYLQDGNIEFQGRADEQLKIRGYRIEPGEIENVLVEQPGIKEAVVLAHSRDGGATREKYLVAYLVPHTGIARDPERFRQSLSQVLPDYMLPSIVLYLDALPLTPSGKIDRRALPEPTYTVLQTQQYVAATTVSEQKLTAIWSQVLALPADQIGIHTSFLALGGQSLLATRVVNQIRDEWKTEIQLSDFLLADTVHGIASLIEDKKKQTAFSEIKVAHRTTSLPLSFAQQRLWFLNQYEGGVDTQYNLPWAQRLKGTLNTSALKKAFQALIQRHESLRTTFHTVKGEPLQVIADSLLLELPVINITPDQVQQYIDKHANHVFDLSTGPLIKVGLLHIADDEHILLVNIHHIVFDGWSITVLNRELSTLYAAFCREKPSPLTPLAFQYADFATWQRQCLQGDALDKQVNYWEKQLQDAPPLLELPTDRPRPAKQTFTGDKLSFKLSSELKDELQQLSQSQGATLFMTLLAGFYVLLSRYSGQHDISVGVPLAGRNRKEFEDLIGFFVNTLVLRNQINSTDSFIDMLQQLKTTTLSAFAHQDIPFEQLVEVLKPERSLSYSPLFQVMFVLQTDSLGITGLQELESEPLDNGLRTAMFDMTLDLVETAGGITGTLEYNIDLFDKTTIQRFTNHYQNLLTSIVAKPEQRLVELPVLSESERQQILYEWNDTKTDYPRNKCIHQLFEEQVVETPDAIAIVYEERRLTYDVLNKKSNQLAHNLLKQGVKPGNVVGMCIERSLDMIVAILGILKAGGAYLPIDPDYPEQRIKFMLEDTEADLLLTQISLVEQLNKSELKQKIMCLDFWSNTDTNLDTNRLTSLPTHYTAYVIYTSGSTGEPKGVAVPQMAVNRLVFNSGFMEFNSTRTFLQASSPSFDATTFEIWGPLLHGGQCILYPDRILSIDKLQTIITSEGIDTVWLTTSFFNLVVDEHPNTISTVKYVLVGGEALSNKHITCAYESCSDIQLINCYGPTENTTFSTYYSIPRDRYYSKATIPIGQSIGNSTTYILDECHQPVPIGVVGRLYTGGAGLALGYVNRPKLTNERFIRNPFSDETNTRLYDTGDLAKYLSDGNIEFVGRLDDQVKIRGFRIEPGEIESVLVEQPEIREAIIIAYKYDDVGKHYLTAYIVCHEKNSLNQTELHSRLKAVFPGYMIPSFFIFLGELPLTANGKVNRKALPIPEAGELQTKEYLAPRNETEKQLVEIWEKVLEVPAEQIGVYSNFFELGGHSLMTTQVISRIQNIFSLRLTIPTLFEAPTIETLAEQIDSAKNTIQETMGIDIQALNDEEAEALLEKLDTLT